jgi:phosphinothricin acetyltransferase
VGFAYAGQFHQRPAYAHTFENSVYVAPGVAGRGIGFNLMNGVLHELRHEREIRQIIALIGDSANAASIALHLKLLFKQVGLLNKVGFKFGRDLDVVIMQRNIAPLPAR